MQSHVNPLAQRTCEVIIAIGPLRTCRQLPSSICCFCVLVARQNVIKKKTDCKNDEIDKQAHAVCGLLAGLSKGSRTQEAASRKLTKQFRSRARDSSSLPHLIT